MKRFLNSTAAISIALMNVHPWPLQAQTLADDGSVLAVDGTVLCAPSGDVVCDVLDPDLIAQAQKIAADIDAEAAAAATEAEASLAAEAATKAEAAEASAIAEAQAAAEAEAARAAEAEATAASDAVAAAKEEEEAAAVEQAEAESKAAAEASVANPDAPIAEAPLEPKAEAPVATSETTAETTAEPTPVITAETTPQDPAPQDPAAGLKTAVETLDPAAVPIAAPEVSEAAMKGLSSLLAEELSGVSDDLGIAPSVAAAASTSGTTATDAPAVAEAVNATTETITETSSRSATEEFSAAPQVVAPGKKNKLSDLEKAGLVVLGALAVGTVLNGAKQAGAAENQQQVVSNTGDRVIVQQADGSYQVLKDDDTLLRRPGNTLRTETFKDGSTQTIVDRPDGSQVVTIRNATGRVLRRAVYDQQGNERVLINDLAQEKPVILSQLPAPRPQSVITTNANDAAIRAALAKRQIADTGRSFSLRQVRNIPQVRHLAAMIEVKNITFASGSSALSLTEIDALADLGAFMQELLAENPAEVFLIEGHTDAVGSAALNLALSDRRAETVALALTQYFNIPAENMVVQGYGETELLIDTQANEQRNRRAAVRIISPLL